MAAAPGFELPWDVRFPQEALEQLRDPMLTLPAWGKVLDQKSSEMVPYDPGRVCPDLQHTILHYYSDTPRTADGRKRWLLALASRQTGKSFTGASCTYVKASYTPGSYSAIIADVKERAEDLFRSVLLLHDNLPDEVRMPTIPNRESRQLTFRHLGKFRTLSADQGAVGIGRSVDNLHMSELPFWSDPGEVWNGLYPAITNRNEASVLMESTPAPMTYGGAAWFRDMCAEARTGTGRWLFHFSPFYMSLLNERPWDKNSRITLEEQKLLDKFGPKGNQPISAPGAPYLTLENLAFRRETMDMDREVRINPDLFFVYYPVDVLTCWQQGGGSAISKALMTRHENAVLVPWPRHQEYMEYAEPKAGALYVMGVDPAGWLGGDQASFQVLEVWADRIEQVATFSSNGVTPDSFADKIVSVARRYNNALVGVESNGVGLATLTLLVTALNRGDIRNLLYEKRGLTEKPGIPATSKNISTALGLLMEALKTELVLHDLETVEQLSTYKNDKLVQESETREILMPGRPAKGRRTKDHWDRVSALLWALYCCQKVPRRLRPEPEPAEKKTGAVSAKDWQRLRKQQNRVKNGR